MTFTTYKAAAAQIGMHPETIRRWVRIYKVPTKRITARTVFLCDDWLDRLFAAGKKAKS